VPFIVSFNASAKGTGADTRYTWDFGEGSSEGGLSRLHVFSEPGSYTVRVLAKGEAGGKFAELQLEALESTIPRNISNIPPTVDLVATVIDPEEPNTVSFLASGQDTPDETLSYVLDFGDGNRTTQASAEHTYAAPGFYLATVVVRDTHNTVALAQAKVVVRAD
jgi:PKD repeat protein